MSIERIEQNWTAYVRCHWRQPYEWDRNIQVGILACPEGMAEVTLDYMRNRHSRQRIQVLMVDTVIGGRNLHLREDRTERDYLTKRGAQIVARRWLRTLNGVSNV